METMWNLDYSSISEISTLMQENGLSMSKKFGQNFLISKPSLEKIVSLAGIEKGKRVWEIGPGLGALTSHMIKTGADVTAFEIDHGFCRILREKAFTDCDNFHLIEGDALKNWQEEYRKNGCPDVICANLPYNVGSVLIASFIENRCLAEKMVFTLQSEVVQRICSTVGDDEYSGFSILTSIDYENKMALKLKNTSFWPMPNVDSAVVVMNRREKPVVPEEYASNFIKICRMIFAQRRKTVRNNLKATQLPSDKLDEILLHAGIDQTERAEKLTFEQILNLAKIINV